MAQSNDGRALCEGFHKARGITKKYAKTFYLASHFLPRPKQLAAYSVYAICRFSDEAVDAKAINSARESLEKIRNNIAAAYTQDDPADTLLKAFQDTIQRYSIPQKYFDELISGMRMDLEISRYPDFNRLKEYCNKVAGVVGLIMLKIIGYSDKQAEAEAINLGTAMQLTNILRDVDEDLMRGRIYLPQQEMRDFNITEASLRSQKISAEWKNLMAFQVRRAREYYKKAQPGIKLINNARSRIVVLIMEDLYSGILDSIEKNGYDVFNRRAYLSLAQKIWRLIKILFTFKYL